MANGIEGIEITKVEEPFYTSSFGFRGVELIKINRQYIAPAFGFKGFEFNVKEKKPVHTKKVIKR